MQSAEVAQQQAVGRGVFDELEVAGFAGLEDARGGEVDCRLIGAGGGGSNKLDGGWVAAGVFEVAVEGGDLVVEGGGELLEGAAKDGEMGGGEAGGRGGTGRGLNYISLQSGRILVEFRHSIPLPPRKPKTVFWATKS